MNAFAAIADDLTGACDVAAELALAGRRVWVAVDADRVAPGDGDGAIVVVNTQSRALDARVAYARVRAALDARPARVLLKKIDTALRGHLGAELDAVVDLLAAPAFVLAAIPAAGRVTRNGCQWFGDRLLADTEFARDPEGPGAMSSIPDVIGCESRRRAAVVGRDVVRAGGLAEVVARLRPAGSDVFVVDAESDADVAAAVEAILALGGPVCLAGSIALTAALAPHLDARPARQGGGEGGVPLPALIVSGSLHSRARAQVDAAVATARAVALALPPPDAGAAEIAALASAVRERLASATSVVVTPAVPRAVPGAEALRATERALASVVRQVAERGPIPTLILIGGETSYAVLTELRAGTIEVHGRVAPLIARGTIGHGMAAGSTVVTKGGSGGEPDVLASLIAAGERG